MKNNRDEQTSVVPGERRLKLITVNDRKDGGETLQIKNDSCSTTNIT